MGSGKVGIDTLQGLAWQPNFATSLISISGPGEGFRYALEHFEHFASTSG